MTAMALTMFAQEERGAFPLLSGAEWQLSREVAQSRGSRAAGPRAELPGRKTGLCGLGHIMYPLCAPVSSHP